MIPAKIEVVLDQVIIEETIKKRLDESLINRFWFVDAKKISELSCLSTRFLEEYVFSDCRMKAIEMKKSRKRIWEASKAFEVMKEILRDF